MNKVAVYGSLREGLGNHHYLADSKLLGTFESAPIYDMYSLIGFPGLKEDGLTSITFEVYEVDNDTLEDVNLLEGYTPDSDDNNFYDRIEIDTPFGKAFTYIYIPDVDELPKVVSGDWKEYSKINNAKSKLINI